MSRVRSKDTTPEMRVRRAAHALGLRFRLHRKDLPGKPDLVFPKHRVAIFVHGCFWHRHPGCAKASNPKSRESFWAKKFEANVMRDKAAADALLAKGWSVHSIWECETRDAEALSRSISRIFSGRMEPDRSYDPLSDN